MKGDSCIRVALARPCHDRCARNRRGGGRRSIRGTSEGGGTREGVEGGPGMGDWSKCVRGKLLRAQNVFRGTLSVLAISEHVLNSQC